MRAAHAVSAGLQMGASELHGLCMEPVELSWGLSLTSADPRETMSEFSAGRDLLAAARGGTGARDSKLDELTGRCT